MTGLISRRARAGTGAFKGRLRAANIVVTPGLGKAALVASVLSALGLVAGCIDRPVKAIQPNTTNLFINRIETRTIEAIDLLFVVDNSISMADKQKLLRQAVPQMVSRLITPDCIDDENRRPNDGQACATHGPEFAPEFTPVDNIHLGVITSSLGGFGSTQCSNNELQPGALDKAQLIPKVRDVVAGSGETVPDPTGLGFLSWTGAGDGDVAQAKAALEDAFSIHVAAAGETGCGFEAPLEAWYRFLVDPEPPVSVEVISDEHGQRSTPVGVDAAILQQRAEFLRPGSLVAIVVLTDENDCSVMEGGNYYPFASSGWMLPRTDETLLKPASDACDTNPNDRCCHSCALAPPAGCEDTCTRPESPPVPVEDDRPGVRCFDGRRRFGVDLLYPTSRYVDGLREPLIVNSRTGEQVQNPLLDGRSPELVFFAGILGVPWQDVATDASLDDPTSLAYRSARELHQVDPSLGASRWQLLLGEPGLPADAPECQPRDGVTPPAECGQAPTPPLDPFMIESISPRSGIHPITGDAIIVGGSSGWSPINGHEYDNSVALPPPDSLPANDDLQYSCIFPLAETAVKVDCTASDSACDCGDEPSRNRPLCKPTESASATADTTQRYGKAYPPSRILRVLRDFGENSIVASICPKVVDDPESPSFGYNPAVNAIVNELAKRLGGQCLPRGVSVTEGEIPCALIEASRDVDACDPAQRRQDLTPEALATMEKRLASTGMCRLKDTDPGTAVLCSEFTICEILEVEDDAKAACFGGTAPEQQAPGFCYIDPAKGPQAGGFPSDAGTCLEGDESTWGGCINPHVTACGATERRILRFVGPATPLPNSTTFVACAGDAANEDVRLPPIDRD